MNLISVHFLILLNITTTCQIKVKEGYLLGSILQRWMRRDNLLYCAWALFYTPTKRVQLSQVKKNSNIFIRNKSFHFFHFFTSIFLLFSFQTTGILGDPGADIGDEGKLVFFWHQSEARTAATVWN